jgi:HD-GYP domain-containing protein (c-di-GMP phosphodiesterase class II)
MEDKQVLARAARDMISQLAVIVRTAQLHNAGNVAVVSSIEKFVQLVNGIFTEEGPVEVELVGEYFYLNGERVKFSMEYLLNFDFLQREFRRRHLGSLRFAAKVAPEDVQAFVAAFISCQFAPDPFEDLASALEKVRSLEPGKIRKIVEEVQDIRKSVKRTYYNAVSFTKGVMNKIRSGERISMKRAKRVVETMVDTLLDREEFLMGMTAIKNYDEYTFHHSVNVSILSIALGQRLGLNKKALMELGIVALFHDLGKTEIPPEILNKPTQFTEEEWEVMKKHPLWGVKIIFQMKSFDAASIRAAIVAYEHHIHHDHTGYPKVKKLSELDLYSRIVSIADQYDGITSSRVYARNPLSPDRALTLMVKRTGTQLDPLLMKFFINLVGIYPVGSLVMLDTREMGLVSGANPSDHLRPKAIIIMDRDGNKIEPFTSDLTEKGQDGNYLRSVVKSLDPHKYRINLADYLG